jgi:hypothetical protein
MPRRTDLLDRIRIPTPCEADWDSMVGNDQVRFCSHCSLNVTNLSSMTRREARRLVRESGGRLCVRYYRRPDGSPLTAPLERLHQVARRAPKVAAGAFGAVLTLSPGAVGQTRPSAGVTTRNAAERAARAPAEEDDVQEGGGASLAGTVLDPNGAVIPNASVTLTNKETGKEQATITDGEGVYRFESLPPGKYSLTAAAPGFAAGEVNDVELQQGAEQRKDAKLEVQGPQETVEVQAEAVEVRAVVMGGAMIVSPKDPLVKAAFEDDLKAVKELLAVGVGVNVVDKDTDTTALAQAVEHGDAEMVLALLGAGADVNLRDGTRQTALMALSDDTSADIVRTLLAAGAKVNLKEEDGDTALTLAAGRVKEDVLRVLIEAGAKVNARNNDGQTALMAAAQEGLVENVRALLLAGADVGAKNNDGETALKLAKDGEYEEVVGLLVAYGAVE